MPFMMLQDCDVPCHTVQVTVSGKNFQENKKNDTALLYFYFAQRVPLSHEHYFYLFLSLIAEIGGYVGLLLGYSFFNVAAFFNTIIQGKIKTMEEKETRDRERAAMVLHRWESKSKSSAAAESEN